jgi:hypothetical protein
MQPYRNPKIMKMVPETRESLVLRTDFTDDVAWESICAAIRKPVGDFRAYVDFVSDPEFEGVTADRLVSLVPKYPYRSFAFIVDKVALTHSEHPALAVDLRVEPGRAFRVIPAEMWSVENNLSLANMGFAEFADAVGSDGVFRGFSCV